MRKPSRFALWLVRSAHDSGTGHRNFPLAFFRGSGANWRRCPTLASEQNSELLLVPILGTPARAKHCVTFRRLSESGTILVPKTGTHFLETNTQNGRPQSFVYAASESSIGPGTMQQISQESFRDLFQIISRRPLRTGRMTALPVLISTQKTLSTQIVYSIRAFIPTQKRPVHKLCTRLVLRFPHKSAQYTNRVLLSCFNFHTKRPVHKLCTRLVLCFPH